MAKCTPAALYSAWQLSQKPSMANLDAAYGEPNGKPTTPPTLDVPRMRPAPRARIAGSTALTSRSAPIKFTSMMAA